MGIDNAGQLCYASGMKQPALKRKWIQIRVTDDEHKRLAAKAVRFGMKLSAFMRDSANRRKEPA
jgi:hypothetical protein